MRLVLLLIADAPGVGDGDEIWLLRGGSGDVFSGHLVRLLVSLLCERGMIWIYPWGVFSGPPSLVAPALDRWVDGPEEGGGLGGGKTGFSKLGGAGGRRCPLRKTKKMDCSVISIFLKGFFVIWGCTVLQV